MVRGVTGKLGCGGCDLGRLRRCGRARTGFWINDARPPGGASDRGQRSDFAAGARVVEVGCKHEFHASLTLMPDHVGMSRYRRPRQTGATIFFTVNFADQASGLLVQQVDILRDAVRQTAMSVRLRWMLGWFCPTTCIAYGHCRKVTPISQPGWVPSRGGFQRWSVGRGFPRHHRYSTSAALSAGVSAPGRTPAYIRATKCRFGRNGFGVSAVLVTVQWTVSGANGRSPGGAADHIRDDADYAAPVNYCWINPVKHGYVDDQTDWP